MDLLPLEIIEYIAKINSETWYKLVRVYHFLYKKTSDIKYVDDLKRKFLLYSTLTPSVNKSAIYKYNEKYHNLNFIVVYYLPNGNLHTFENPCIVSCCLNTNHLLHVWYKDNKIHRDDDNPSVIHVRNEDKSLFPQISIIQERIFKDILHLFPQYYWLDDIQMWFKHGLPHRDNDLPAIIRGNHKEWRQNGLLHRNNGMPPCIIFGVKTWNNYYI